MAALNPQNYPYQPKAESGEPDAIKKNSSIQLESNLAHLKNLPRQLLRERRIKIDLTKTEYPLMRTVTLFDLNWTLWCKESEQRDDACVFWTDTYITEDCLRRLRPYQRINHFPTSAELGKKNLLSDNLNRLKRMLPHHYAFYPKTWCLPQQQSELVKHVESHPSAFMIVKPSASSQGRGIHLTLHPQAIKEQCVVQQYLERPLLIDGYKFDLRLYVLLRSVSPLKVYLYSEGLARLSTAPYAAPDNSNSRNMRMHLTNYAINKLSPDYVFNKDYHQDNVGHKRSYTAILDAIRQEHAIDTALLQVQIDEIIVKTILSTWQTSDAVYKECRDSKADQGVSLCFEVLGFDIIIDSAGKPYLLEVNHSPSFLSETPLDEVIKRCLLTDTLSMLQLNPDHRLNFIHKRPNEGQPKNFDPVGGYRQIYPVPKDTPVCFNSPAATQKLTDARKAYSEIMRGICRKDSKPLQELIDNNYLLYGRLFRRRKNLLGAEDKPQPRSQVALETSTSGMVITSRDSAGILSLIQEVPVIESPRRSKQRTQQHFKTPQNSNSVRHKNSARSQQPNSRESSSQKKPFLTPIHLSNIHIEFRESTNVRNTFRLLPEEQIRRQQAQTARQSDGIMTAKELVELSDLRSQQRQFCAFMRARISKMHMAKMKIHKTRRLEKGGVMIVVTQKDTSLQKHRELSHSGRGQ